MLLTLLLWRAVAAMRQLPGGQGGVPSMAALLQWEQTIEAAERQWGSSHPAVGRAWLELARALQAADKDSDRAKHATKKAFDVCHILLNQTTEVSTGMTACEGVAGPWLSEGSRGGGAMACADNAAVLVCLLAGVQASQAQESIFYLMAKFNTKACAAKQTRDAAAAAAREAAAATTAEAQQPDAAAAAAAAVAAAMPVVPPAAAPIGETLHKERVARFLAGLRASHENEARQQAAGVHAAAASTALALAPQTSSAAAMAGMPMHTQAAVPEPPYYMPAPLALFALPLAHQHALASSFASAPPGSMLMPAAAQQLFGADTQHAALARLQQSLAFQAATAAAAAAAAAGRAPGTAGAAGGRARTPVKLPAAGLQPPTDTRSQADTPGHKGAAVPE
jgi:hypothetical protein